MHVLGMAKTYFLTISSLLCIQSLAYAKAKDPLIPRLRYSTTGRQLDFTETITFFLAEYNSQGFPLELFYRVLEDATDLPFEPSMGDIAKALRSADVQHSVEEAALDHFADVLNEPEAHFVVEDSGKEQWAVCSYSWLSWIPWLGCPNEMRSSSGLGNSKSEENAECFAPKSIQL